MPTTLPDRTSLTARSHDSIDFVSKTISFYAVIAIGFALVLAIEHHLGMFTGMSIPEAVLRASGTDFPYSQPELIGLF
jgi:hypothetical protein